MTKPHDLEGSPQPARDAQGRRRHRRWPPPISLGAPMIWAQNIKDVTLRQFGTGVSNLNDVAREGEGGPRLHAGR